MALVIVVSYDVGSLILKCWTRFIVSQYPQQKLWLSFQYKARSKAFGLKKQLCQGIEFARESNVPWNKQVWIGINKRGRHRSYGGAVRA
jgi:hypothetical protein